MRLNRKKYLAAMLSVVLLVTCLLQTHITKTYADETIIHLSTAEDLKQFVQNCRLDTWSEGRKVYLDNDIDLQGEPLTPIPTFSGDFDGQSHTISGFVCANDGSNQGLFRYVQESGRVSNLFVEGEVLPQEGKCNIGGLVGTNYGTITSCKFTGTVKGLINTGGICGLNQGTLMTCESNGQTGGKQYTGGVCGYNSGSIVGCVNNASVNIEIETGQIDITSLTLIDLVDIGNISITDTDTVMDTGGIVGGSEKIVTGCTNYGTIGYQHFGYNVGGIAGRQNGYLNECENYGEVYGRKDVAGICGQMEPYLFLEDSESLVDELQTLNDRISAAMSAMGSDAAAMSGTLNSLKGTSDAATASAQQYGQIVSQLGQQGINSYYESQDSSSESGSSFGDTVSGIASDTGNVIGGLDESTKDDILNGNVSEDTWSDVENSFNENGGSTGDAIGGIGDKIEGDAGNVDQETKDDIASGDISSSDIENIAGAVNDSSGAQSIRDAIAAQKAQDAAEAAAQQARQNKMNSALASAQAALASKVNTIGQALASLNDNMANITANLAENLNSVNDQFTKVNRLMTRILTGDMTYYEDVSMYDTEADIDGKVNKCVNYGHINADENVGGIAGEMAIEVEFDAEGDIVSNGLAVSGIVSKMYETRAVIRGCANEAPVEGRKSAVGGVVGNNDVGVVFESQNYGDVRGDTQYVGGIAGTSANWVSDCYSMCNLSGEAYIGGIVGNGTQVTDSFAVVSIEDETSACSGAIAGYLDVTLANAAVNNYFVSDTLGAIDGISYGGMAEPTTYEEMMTREGIPDEFRYMIVSFVADGVTVKIVKVAYDEAVPADQIPEVPVKEGYVGEWEERDLSNIRESCVVQAIYAAKQSSMAVSQTREEDGLSMLLVEGDFEGNAEVELTEYEGALPELTETTETIVEAWKITLNNVEEDTEYRVRFLVPEKEQEYKLYKLNGDGSLEEMEAEKKGSYLAFGIDGSEEVFALAQVQKTVSPWVYGGIGAGVLLVLILLITLIRKKK